MKKLSLVDYVYYVCCRFYEKHGEDSGAGISGLVLLSLFQVFNIIVVYEMCLLVNPHIPFNPNIRFNQYWIAIGCLVLLIISGIYCNKYNYNFLKERLVKEDEKIKNKKIMYAQWYMVSSIILLLGSWIFAAVFM